MTALPPGEASARTHAGPTQQMVDSAAGHLMDGIARNDARAPRDAAIASLGPDASEAQITDWLARYRPEGLTANTA